ncbi:hypothetical protein Mterra_03452 [Calidithermus terrae]|uniref:Uncharacterized protein n=1 Tax=Calidithermus terrae TaxID=1408545 RepID=A0A399ECY1_9DEIN|nr:hypothetical protein [Calidithermus terrae]RIH80810.1 hypothetical protein Mterra_03452 [Calidithermus terrae]
MKVYEFRAEESSPYRYIMPERLQAVDRLKRRFLGVEPLAEGWEGFEVHPVPAHLEAPVTDANVLLGVLAVSKRFRDAFEPLLYRIPEVIFLDPRAHPSLTVGEASVSLRSAAPPRRGGAAVR